MTVRPLIGVFDSGFGGLTVLRELLVQVPGADFIYLGDTAHLPYGSKSAEAVTRYTSAAIQLLTSRGAEFVVIACNTASALALPTLQGHATVALAGVIAPGSQAAAAIAPPESTALILATEGTVASHAYARACAAHGLHAVEKACPLFVPLVEEGWTTGSITEQIATIYLTEALALAPQTPSVIVLGCTHYPLLAPTLRTVVDRLAGPVPIVDSAQATATHVASLLPHAAEATDTPALTFLATDAADKFKRLGERFLGRAIPHVQRVDLDT